MPSDQTSSPIDVLVSVSRDAHGRLGAQIEDQLRCAVRTGKAKPGTRLPSTRDLAGQLGVSRHVVVESYSQL
ncbi:MAG: GntR family transcriptional regulator, partial [Thermocrispum sp.]